MPLLRYFGLSRPYRFERTISAGFAFLLALLALIAAVWMRETGLLVVRGPRGEYFLYLMILLGLALLLVPWPRLPAVILALAAFELAFGAGLLALQRAGIAPVSFMPVLRSEPPRFQWHATLQAVPIPSLSMTSSTGLPIQHTSQGTRGKDPVGSLDGRTVVATVGGSTTYDLAVGEGDTWSDRLGAALDQGSDKGRFFIVNHGVPGYTTAEHLIQTAFYQNKFGKPPRCAIYYVGWNDLRNSHIPDLDPGYADFHLPNQVDALRVRRVDRPPVTISPLFNLVMRFVGRYFDTVREYPNPFNRPPVNGPDSTLEALYQRNIRTISAINRERGVVTIWVGQLLNRNLLTGEGRYGWLPLVRDRDVWPLQQRFNTILERTAKELGDIYVDVPIDSFGDADFADHGHFTKSGSKRFGEYLAPIVRDACR